MCPRAREASRARRAGVQGLKSTTTARGRIFIHVPKTGRGRAAILEGRGTRSLEGYFFLVCLPAWATLL